MTDTTLPFTLDSARQYYGEIFAPWIQDLNITIESLDSKQVIMRMPFDNKLCRIGGIVCGQSQMALIDTCMVFVCFIGLKKFTDCATVTQNSSFLRPAIGKDIIATGRVVKAGRTLVFGEVILNAAGDPRPISTGTATYAVLGQAGSKTK